MYEIGQLAGGVGVGVELGLRNLLQLLFHVVFLCFPLTFLHRQSAKGPIDGCGLASSSAFGPRRLKRVALLFFFFFFLFLAAVLSLVP